MLASVGAANPNCVSFIERTVWDGDQTLYELRTPGAVADSQKFEYESDTGAFRGAVGYVHGGAIDQPLVVYRYGASGNTSSWVGLVPFPNWRGDYEIGVVATGPYAGQRTDVCPGGTSGCPIVTWPGATTRVDGDKIDRWTTPTITWTGNLLSGRADGSGLMYRRNRYYDPASGRFTQADPIGLAGGLNAYGLAHGDAVNFFDPFGLCPKIAGTEAPCALFVAAMGETDPRHAGVEAAALTNVLINRAEDEGTSYARGPGRRRTGDLAADVEAQASDPKQVQGNNPNDKNTQDDQMRNVLFNGGSFTDAASARKATKVITSVEETWRNRTGAKPTDATKGATHWWHPGDGKPTCSSGPVVQTGQAGNMRTGECK